jgi:hypothetical protein
MAAASVAARKRKLGEAMEILKSLGFGPRQSNEVAAYTFLALIDLAANAPWSAASNPLRGITPVIESIAKAYGVRYAPNTRETIRDEAVKYFVEAGLLLRNPDNPNRPTNSGQTVYQVEPIALALVRTFGTKPWPAQLKVQTLQGWAGFRDRVCDPARDAKFPAADFVGDRSLGRRSAGPFDSLRRAAFFGAVP